MRRQHLIEKLRHTQAAMRETAALMREAGIEGHPQEMEGAAATVDSWIDGVRADRGSTTDGEINKPAPHCVECGDGIVAHDPGICGCCYAIKYQKGEPLLDAPGVAPVRARKATDEEIRAWADRHGLGDIGSTAALRCMFEDAQTLIPSGAAPTGGGPRK